MDYKSCVIEYLQTVDNSLDVLSQHNEGKLQNLPSWVLQKRTIEIGVTTDGEGIVLKINPDDNLEEDVFVQKEIRTAEEASDIISPMSLQGRLPNAEPENSFVLFADLSIVEANSPLAVPAIDNRFMLGWGRSSAFFNHFTPEKAKEEAIQLWNSVSNNLKSKQNYVQKVRGILEKLQAIIKRKAFLERRIHRFINEHRAIFLPSHKKCLYEHRLYLREDMRKADFILEREQGLPAIFIELESPVHKVLTKSNDLTAQSNHARQQISEWVKFVEQNPQQNATNENSFMTGPKERMVIIGRGLENQDRLIDTKYDGVTFWTYTMMLEEARERLNNSIASQYNLLELEALRPF